MIHSKESHTNHVDLFWRFFNFDPLHGPFSLCIWPQVWICFMKIGIYFVLCFITLIKAERSSHRSTRVARVWLVELVFHKNWQNYCYWCILAIVTSWLKNFTQGQITFFLTYQEGWQEFDALLFGYLIILHTVKIFS